MVNKELAGPAEVWRFFANDVGKHLWPSTEDTGRSTTDWVTRFERKIGAVRIVQIPIPVTCNELEWRSPLNGMCTGRDEMARNDTGNERFAWDEDEQGYVIDLDPYASGERITQLVSEIAEASHGGKYPTRALRLKYALWSDVTHCPLVVEVIRGNHLYDTTCLTHVFFKRGE